MYTNIFCRDHRVLSLSFVRLTYTTLNDTPNKVQISSFWEKKKPLTHPYSTVSQEYNPEIGAVSYKQNLKKPAKTKVYFWLVDISFKAFKARARNNLFFLLSHGSKSQCEIFPVRESYIDC